MNRFLNILLKKKIINSNLFLLFIAIIFLVLTALEQNNLINIDFTESILENIQAVILLVVLILTFFYRRTIKNKFGPAVLYLRLFVGSFVLYEELSFLSSNFCNACDSFNAQNELNLHNMPLFQYTVLTKLPFIDELYLMTVLLFSFILLLSWGSFLPLLNRIKGIFLEKRFSLLGSLFIFERVISQIFSNLNFLTYIDNKMPWIIHPEFLELHLYLVLLFDLFYKIKSSYRFSD